MTFREYPTAKVAEWIDSNRVPSRRAWKRFTDWAFERYGDFAEMSGAGGFSGAPKLTACIIVIRRLREAGEPLPSTVGECLDLARERNWSLGWLPPYDLRRKIAKTAGRSDLFAN